MRLLTAGLLSLLCCCTSSCETKSTEPPLQASPTTSLSTATESETSGTSVASRAESAHKGRWAGSFDAKKSEVSVPKGVPYRIWEKDDGSARSGKGQIELRVDAAGLVRGTLRGALGELVCAGLIDQGVLRVGLRPAKPNAPDAMSGVLTGKVLEGTITAKLTVSSHDGSLARAATLTLNHK